ncbi:MAG: thiamine biosynthesis protein ApbE [SAR86 cluster bacterium]|uniref:FAD:protein FMN transferase n=1 Tax=SAR86 cluster bacterium TaxID=2030880 RepID=A0A2A4MJY2_9GAMM|nr:MAG: thiamine biosynthesis protein ApbE [SAR86 cluster bacterium]
MTPTLKRFSFKAMGSYCEIQIYDNSRISAKEKTKRLANEVNRLEKKYSRYSQSSIIAEINSAAGAKLGIKLDKETSALFDHAQRCYEQSDGLFDITSGILREVWDFQSGEIPSQQDIDKRLEFIGFDKLERRQSRLIMPKFMEIDLGGIVKEYAADAAANLGRSLGIEHGLVNLGGDFAVIGPQPDNQPWTIGVANPKQPSQLMAKIDLLEGGLASSGDYERCFIHQGKRYSHILNPLTGWPSDGLRAVSVAANLCTVAGSLSTIAMLKAEPESIAYLADIGLPHVYMDSNESVEGQGLNNDTVHS